MLQWKWNQLGAGAAMALLLMLPGQSFGQKATDVKVVNVPPVTIADRPEKQPFVDTLVSGSKTFRVPAGKRLVIEHVSGTAFVTSGQKLFVTALQYSALLNGGTPAEVLGTLAPVPVGTKNTGANLFDIFAISQQTRFYVEPFGLVSVHLENASGLAGVTLTVSGYLVDVP